MRSGAKLAKCGAAACSGDRRTAAFGLAKSASADPECRSDCARLIAASALFGVELGGLIQKRQPYGPKLTSNLGFLDSFSQSEAPVGLLSEEGLVLHGTLAFLSSTMRFFP
jgi:hypothetical protein